MIWNSLLGMTVVDLAVVGMGVALLWAVAKRGTLRTASPGARLIVTGIVVVTVAYFADLFAMHAATWFLNEATVAQLRDFTHVEARWLATLISTPLLVMGFEKINRERADADQQLQSVTDALPIGIAYVDSDRCVLFANSLYATWYGQPITSIVGKTMAEFIAPEILNELQPHAQRALSGKAVSFDSPLSYARTENPDDLHSQLVPDIRDDGTIAGFHVLITDLTERHALEREVVAAGERERNAIGRDLHDNLGQILTGTSLSLQALSSTLAKEDSHHAGTVEELRATVQRTIDQVRKFTRRLAPAFEQRDLAVALESLADDVKRMFKIECVTDCSAAKLVTDPEAATHLYRIVQESVTNAARHGKAGKIYIRCQSDAVWFRIEIVDNGIGIEPHENIQYGMGINTMRYRSKMISGFFQLEAGPDGGTRVLCTCPLRALTATSASEPT